MKHTSTLQSPEFNEFTLRINATIEQLQIASGEIAKYIDALPAGPDKETQTTNLTGVLGGLTIQISSLHGILDNADVSSNAKTDLLDHAASSLQRVGDFLSSAQK